MKGGQISPQHAQSLVWNREKYHQIIVHAPQLKEGTANGGATIWLDEKSVKTERPHSLPGTSHRQLTSISGMGKTWIRHYSPSPGSNESTLEKAKARLLARVC